MPTLHTSITAKTATPITDVAEVVITDKQQTVFNSPNKPHLIIIGAGMAGTRFAFELAEVTDAYAITLINSEPHAGYNRIMLSPVLAGEKTFADIGLYPEADYKKYHIQLLTHTTVTAIDIDNKSLTLEHHTQTNDSSTSKINQAIQTLSYAKLVFATGSTPFMLPLPNADAKGVLAFRTKQDVDDMVALASKQGSRCIVIGGGLLGLECANALVNHGANVTVVHIGNYLLERQLDATSANLLQAHFEAKGIEFCLQGFSEGIEVNDKHEVTGLRLIDGTVIEADCIVMTVGVRPNIALAREAGVPCDKGILVDAYMHTECDDVYAIGECVQFETHLFGLVAPVYAQASVLVEALLDDLLDNCSDDRANKGADTYLDKGSDQLPHRKKTPKSKPFSVQATATKLKVSGVNLFSAGNIHAIEHGVESQNDAFQNCEFLTYHDPSQGIYQKLTLQNNRLVGAVLYGDVNDGAWFFDLMQNQTDVQDFRDSLLFGQALCGVN